uniref:ATP-dependent Clp protease proteolytic subunit n=1 Tax=Plumbago auriculata TaxID=45172 RepID=D3WEW9_PLUAU|nr:clp protease proteolytic subunit [Plumbago auriculata]ADD31120.1 clp protease proteolytic subunit protein [Plumbago auriculata]QBC69184.1 clp protease proteolytic subunit [Plumbago auriculata]QBE86590.1 clp protease proteolytic subunit [Plumbago auriculata]
MPIGVPKVPFLLPENEDATWVDVYNRLYRSRFLFLGEELNTEIGNFLMGLIIYLGIEDETKELFLFLNCPGGWVLPGLGVVDAMEIVTPDVNTICIGIAASMGSFILVAGEITKRAAFPHARVMIHQPKSAFYEDQSGICMMEIEEIIILRENITNFYIQRTGQPLWVIMQDLERDAFLSATEAQAHRIVDIIL